MINLAQFAVGAIVSLFSVNTGIAIAGRIRICGCESSVILGARTMDPIAICTGSFYTVTRSIRNSLDSGASAR